MDKIIISASGYLKEATHDGYRIFISVPVDYRIFCPWSHFLSVECRKSRNSSFSIFSRLFSYLYSASVFAGLRPRVFGRTDSFSQQWIAHRLIPYSWLKARWLSPALIRDTTSSRIPAGYFFIPFFPDIARPPYVVLLSYIRGLFVIVRFYWTCSKFLLELQALMSLPEKEGFERPTSSAKSADDYAVPPLQNCNKGRSDSGFAVFSMGKEISFLFFASSARRSGSIFSFENKKRHPCKWTAPDCADSTKRPLCRKIWSFKWRGVA